MNAQAKKLVFPILGVPLNILDMVEILKNRFLLFCWFDLVNLKRYHGNVTISHQIWKSSPLEEGSKRWFWKPMSSRLPALLDKHFDGRPKYISCCVGFLKLSNENLIVDYKHMLAMPRNKTGIFSYWHFIKKWRPSVRQFSVSCLPNLCSAICYFWFW